ncbi:MAG TPA: hypothetical protein VEJ63_13210 [Planctomycetota bacterium]|nr:hypothetical protein [Planctomycetota bacterium]
MRHILLCLLSVFAASSLFAEGMPFPAPKRAKEEWRENINTALAKKGNVDFDKKPLPDAIKALKELLGVNFVIDPANAPKAETLVTLKQKDIVLSEALKQTLAKGEMAYQVQDGAIFIYHTKKTDMEMLRPEELPVARIMDGREEQLDFQPTNEEAGELLKQLTEPAGMKLAMVDELKKKPITLELKNVRLGHAIRWLYRFAGGKIEVKTDGMTIVKR